MQDGLGKGGSLGLKGGFRDRQIECCFRCDTQRSSAHGSLLCTFTSPTHGHGGLLFLQGLAKSVAWDGEGATCLMEVSTGGAPDDKAALTIAKSIAGSSLVKAAVFGHDPNWGRIACAAG